MKFKNIILIFVVIGLVLLGFVMISYVVIIVIVVVLNGNFVYVMNIDKGFGGYLGVLIKKID